MSDSSTENKLDRLRHALDSGRVRGAQRMLQSLHPAEIALLLESMPQPEREVAWGMVPDTDRGEVLLHVPDEVRTDFIRDMEISDLLAAAEGLEIDDLADLIEDLPEVVTQQVLRSMDLQNRQRLEAVLSYPADSAGGLMNMDVVTVRPDVTVDVVLRYLRQRGQIPQPTYTLFIVDREGHYLGVLPLYLLLTLDGECIVSDVMNSDVAGIDAMTQANQVAQRFENHDLVSAPVIDKNGLLLGRITVDDVVDVIRDEAEHSLMSMAGLDEEEDLFAPITRSARRRAVWLGVNLMTAFMAAWVVGQFEATIQQVVALAVLMPVVASMGGIGGSQTLTLMIRGLAVGSISSANAKQLLLKEVLVAAINGIVWAAVVGGIVYWWFNSPMLCLVIGMAMIINQVIAAFSGVGLPLLMKRLNIDPALAGSVVLTTITDVLGFFAFLGLGALILL